MDSWGQLGSHFGCSGLALAPFWKFWGFLGLYFGGSGGALGSILGVLGVQWVALGVPGASLAAQGAQSEIYPIFSVPFGNHFCFILEVKNAPKSDASFDGFVNGVFVVLGWISGPVLRICWSFVNTFYDMAKTRKIAACGREHQNRRMG